MRGANDIRRPLRLAGVILGLMALLNGSCARRATTVDQATQAGVLHLSVGSEPTDLDPQTVTGLGDAKIIAALFEPIVTFDPVTLAPRPALAERWEISPDGLVYTFHLRPTARWSNGDPITAEDCIASWRRILTPTLAADYAYFFYIIRGAESFHKGQTTDFSTVGLAAPDPRTLVVTLAHPAPWRP